MNISSFPHWDLEQQERFISDIAIPDDILSDILEAEVSTLEEVEQFKQELNGQ